MEQFKLNPDDFGGFQDYVLTVEEAAQRYCARRWCSDHGLVQTMIPGEEGRLYRVLCGRHFVMMMIVQAASLGDPSPIGEGRRLAEKMGIPFDSIPDLHAPQIVSMDLIVCDRCGGGAVPETIGMFAGKRWIHTCMTEEEKEAERRAG